MNIKTLIQLDYTRIRESVSSFCLSEEGKKAAAQSIPLTDKLEADRIKARAMAWTKLISAVCTAAAGRGSVWYTQNRECRFAD